MSVVHCFCFIEQECIPVGCVPSAAVVISEGGRCVPIGVFAWGGCTPPPLWTDRHLWKHNLSATTVADGNERKTWTGVTFRKSQLEAVGYHPITQSWKNPGKNVGKKTKTKGETGEIRIIVTTLLNKIFICPPLKGYYEVKKLVRTFLSPLPFFE